MADLRVFVKNRRKQKKMGVFFCIYIIETGNQYSMYKWTR